MLPGLACIGALDAAELIDRKSRPAKRANALQWADGLVTASGRNRGVAIATCGRPAAAISGAGSVGLVALRCRDRACPSCQAMRAHRLSERMVRLREELPGRWVFLTLTKRKKPAAQECCADAVDAVQEGWRQTFNKKYSSGRRIADMVEGGVKAMEITARAPGEKNKDGSAVRYFGWHVHLHALVRLRDGVTQEKFMREVTARWTEVVDATTRGVDVRKADDKATRYLCKYVVKPLEKSIGRGRGRELFQAVHGRRMLEGFYGLRSWKRLVPESKRDPLLIAVQALGDVFEDRKRVIFQGWERTRPIPSSREEAWESKQQIISLASDAVLDALKKGGGGARWWTAKQTGPPPFIWRAGQGVVDSRGDVDGKRETAGKLGEAGGR